MEGLLEIRVFIHLSSFNSITTLQRMIILILKLELMRLRESLHIAPEHPAHKLQSQNLRLGLYYASLSCLPPFHAASIGVRMRPSSALGVPSCPAVLPRSPSDWDRSSLLAPVHQWNPWVPSYYFPLGRHNTSKQGSALYWEGADIQTQRWLCCSLPIRHF